MRRNKEEAGTMRGQGKGRGRNKEGCFVFGPGLHIIPDRYNYFYQLSNLSLLAGAGPGEWGGGGSHILTNKRS